MNDATPPSLRARIVADSEAKRAEAAARLADGRLVALPTETVYGLAARADRDDAVAGIYRAKGRPAFNPLIVHVFDASAAERLAEIDSRARRLIEAFWPGPLTLVLPRRADAALADAVTAGLATVALRSPAHPVIRSILRATDFPLAAPSANRSGSISPTQAAHVAHSLSDNDVMIIDGGTCRRGVESTIVAMRRDGWQILRPGPIDESAIAAVLGESPQAEQGGRPIEAPGQLASHYAPGKPVRLNAREPEADEFHIGFGAIGGEWSLSPNGDLTEAASRLFAALHIAAASARPRIAVAPVPETGIGRAINDRLRRAAAG